MFRVIKIGIVVFGFVITIPCLTFAQEALMKITSPAFAHNQSIPTKFTCQGEDVNPALQIEGIPEGTQALALIMDDPDAPIGTWVHWVLYNINPTIDTIQENSIPGVQGLNSFGKLNYGGPCPPSGTHRYFFKLYALDSMSDLVDPVTKESLEGAMKGSILAKAELIGFYKKY